MSILVRHSGEEGDTRNTNRVSVLSALLILSGGGLLGAGLWTLVGLGGLVATGVVVVLSRLGGASWAVFAFGQAGLLVAVPSDVTSRALDNAAIEPVTLGAVVAAELGLGFLLLSRGGDERGRQALEAVALFLTGWVGIASVGLLAWQTAGPWFGALAALFTLGGGLYLVHRDSHVRLRARTEADT